MDLSNLFNLNGDEEKDSGKSFTGKSSSNMSAVEDLLKEVTEKFNQSSKPDFTEEDAYNAFEDHYGDMKNFMENHWSKMTEEYEESTVKHIHQHMQNRGKADYGMSVAGGMIEASKLMVQKIIVDNSESKDEAKKQMTKSAMIAQTIDNILPNDTPRDDMLTCLAMLGIAYVRLGELTAHAEAERLAQEKRN